MNKNILILTILTSTSCTASELGRVSDASDKRRVVCEFIGNASGDNPTLQKAREACDAGDDLEAIARAYGGCEVE